MSSRFLSAVTLAACSLLPAASATLRVCADPNNMPYSNQQGEGFENKIAQLLAETLGDTLEYTWWAERKSFVKNSLNAGRCDVVLGIPASLPDIDSTRPYYRSSYVFVSRHNRKLGVTSLGDPRLAQLRIGVPIVGDDYAPPAFALARRGITRNIVGFSLFGANGDPSPGRKIIDAVERGDVDLAIVWGPFAGYFAQSAQERLDLAPVKPPMFLGIPFTYEIAMGVRKGDAALKSELNTALESDSAAIQRILVQYGVPQVP